MDGAVLGIAGLVLVLVGWTLAALRARKLLNDRLREKRRVSRERIEATLRALGKDPSYQSIIFDWSWPKGADSLTERNRAVEAFRYKAPTETHAKGAAVMERRDGTTVRFDNESPTGVLI